MVYNLNAILKQQTSQRFAFKKKNYIKKSVKSGRN